VLLLLHLLLLLHSLLRSLMVWTPLTFGPPLVFLLAEDASHFSRDLGPILLIHFGRKLRTKLNHGYRPVYSQKKTISKSCHLTTKPNGTFSKFGREPKLL
jgi:hypothetical protein